MARKVPGVAAWRRHSKTELAELIRPLRQKRLTHAEIAAVIGKSDSTVQRICKLFGIEKLGIYPNIDMDAEGDVS